MGEKRFPILDAGFSIPWRLIAPYEAQARENHNQSLKRLAERGGLDVSEARAVIEGRDLRSLMNSTSSPVQDRKWLLDYVRRDEVGALNSKVADLTAQHQALCIKVAAAFGAEHKDDPDLFTLVDRVVAERDALTARLAEAEREHETAGALLVAVGCDGDGYSEHPSLGPAMHAVVTIKAERARAEAAEAERRITNLEGELAYAQVVVDVAVDHALAEAKAERGGTPGKSESSGGESVDHCRAHTAFMASCSGCRMTLAPSGGSEAARRGVSDSPAAANRSAPASPASGDDPATAPLWTDEQVRELVERGVDEYAKRRPLRESHSQMRAAAMRAVDLVIAEAKAKREVPRG